MTKKPATKTLLLCLFSSFVLAIVISGASPQAAFAQQSRPNLVIFLADDAGWGDYRCNGNEQVATPQIDSIAREGMTLTRFYVCPVCSPTRAEFLTGRYHTRTGVTGVSNGQERLNLDEYTLADAFKSAGYSTGIFGKWHNGSQWPYHPMARGFDEFYGYTSGHWGEYFDPPLEHNGQPIRAKGYIVDACTSQAIDFIDRHRDKPFLCYIPFTTPHSPWAVPSEDWERFKDKPIVQRGTNPKQEDTSQTRCALAMIENQDRNVGRVLDKLRELNLDESTIVVYFSDNGPNTDRWNGGMKGRKGSTDEGGVRSACFVRWNNRIESGSTYEGVSGAIDLLPTLTALAGVKIHAEKPLDGIDQSAFLLGDSTAFPDRTLFTAWAGNVAARKRNFLLDAAGSLYDFETDPAQKSSLNRSHAELRESMQASVRRWREEMRLDSLNKPLRNTQVDARPISVGYKEFARSWLPARDAEATGKVRRSAPAPKSSYFVNWTSVDDRIRWNVRVETSGTYRVEILYTCPIADIGSTVRLTCGSATLDTRVAEAWDPPLYDNQDTLPRPPAESKMKPFKTQEVGKLELREGEGPLVLQAIDFPGNQVMDLRAVVLTLVDEVVTSQ